MKTYASLKFIVGAFTIVVTCCIYMQMHYINSSIITPERENYNSSLREDKILCWVLTCWQNHDSKAIHVKNTWGKRCDKLIFMSSANNSSLPSVDLGVKYGRQYLWKKTRKALQYIYDHHLEEYGWFMKADDDTFVIVENLRYSLSSHNPYKVPIAFGRRIKGGTPNGFMSGGAGYVLSQKAIKMVVEEALFNPYICPETLGEEDVEIAKCLYNVGVITGESRDSQNRGTFFPQPLHHHLHPKNIIEDNWFKNNAYHSEDRGLNCCSHFAISFHYIQPHIMYELEYLIYALHPFGVKYSEPVPFISDLRVTNTT